MLALRLLPTESWTSKRALPISAPLFRQTPTPWLELTPPTSFTHRYVRKDAHYDPARPHQQHAILRHRIAIIPGLRHASGDLVGHRSQLDPARQLGPDIRVERGAGRLVLERLVDGAALIVRKRLEDVGNGDELVVGRVLR